MNLPSGPKSFLRKTYAFLALVSLFVPVAGARQTTALCGTHPDRLLVDLHLHRKARESRTGRGGGIARQAADVEKRPATRVAGDIVLMEDADGVVSRRNDFNLDERTVTFSPTSATATAYRFSVDGVSYDTGAATTGTSVELDDDDAQQVTLPFPFPFYGQAFSTAFIHSDGNITFERPDADSSARSLDRVTAGPPRIAPLFRDLDPTRAVNGVRALLDAGRVVVSWDQVPEYSDFSGRGPLQTFQARLYPDGRIEFAFDGITTVSAVVAISPGNLQGSTRVVSFVDGSTDEFSGTVAERFTRLEELDYFAAAQKFYEENDDAYDYLVFYNNLDLEADVGTVAFEVTVRSDREGIGTPAIDIGALLGSPHRLQGVMNMGPLSQYPDDPNAVVPKRATTRDTPVTVLGHEAGHLFLAFASVRDPFNPDSKPMLGRDGAHWSFVFNSEASLLEGNRICDRERETCPPDPAGSRRFVTTATVEGYSALDQYLMGFAPPEEVPDMFVVEDSNILTASRPPQSGVNFNGLRRDIRIDELIAVEGRRTPDHTVSQRSFRLAFVLVHAAGQEPSAEDIEKVDRFRREFEGFYLQSSGGRASVDTAIRQSLRLSVFPATGVLAGASVAASLSVSRPAGSDLDVLLTSANGGAAIPPSVRIPAGETAAQLTLHGARVGVDEITAEIPGQGFELARAKVQVLAAAASLRVVPVSGDKQINMPGAPLPEPIVVRVVDINNVPYPGIRVQGVPSAGGQVTPVELVTNLAGEAVFEWTPANTVFNDLTVTVADAPGATPALITTTGTPLLTAEGVVNAASYGPNLSPGALASIFGANLAAGAEEAASLPIPNELADVRVLLNGIAVPLLYVSDRQINFAVPLATPVAPASLVVSTPLGDTEPVIVPVQPVSPAIFVMPDTDLGAVTVSGTGQLTSARPAAPGEFIEIYCTGLGPVEQFAPGSLLNKTVRDPVVSIADVPVAEIQFSGLAPGFIGLYQVNAQVGQGVPSGRQTLTLTIDGTAANPVDIMIQ